MHTAYHTILNSHHTFDPNEYRPNCNHVDLTNGECEKDKHTYKLLRPFRGTVGAATWFSRTRLSNFFLLESVPRYHIVLKWDEIGMRVNDSSCLSVIPNSLAFDRKFRCFGTGTSSCRSHLVEPDIFFGTRHFQMRCNTCNIILPEIHHHTASFFLSVNVST